MASHRYGKSGLAGSRRKSGELLKCPRCNKNFKEAYLQRHNCFGNYVHGHHSQNGDETELHARAQSSGNHVVSHSYTTGSRVADHMASTSTSRATVDRISSERASIESPKDQAPRGEKSTSPTPSSGGVKYNSHMLAVAQRLDQKRSLASTSSSATTARQRAKTPKQQLCLTCKRVHAGRCSSPHTLLRPVSMDSGYSEGTLSRGASFDYGRKDKCDEEEEQELGSDDDRQINEDVNSHRGSAGQSRTVIIPLVRYHPANNLSKEKSTHDPSHVRLSGGRTAAAREETVQPLKSSAPTAGCPACLPQKTGPFPLSKCPRAHDGRSGPAHDCARACCVPRGPQDISLLGLRDIPEDIAMQKSEAVSPRSEPGRHKSTPRDSRRCQSTPAMKDPTATARHARLQDEQGYLPIIDIAKLTERAEKVMRLAEIDVAPLPADDAVKMLKRFFRAEVKVFKRDLGTGKDVPHRFRGDVERKLNENTGWTWKHLNTGSHYDGTKVTRTDELDFMFFPKIPETWLELDFTGTPAEFCYLKLKPAYPADPDLKKQYAELKKLCCDPRKTDFISSQMFREKIFSVIREAVKDNRRVKG